MITPRFVYSRITTKQGNKRKHSKTNTAPVLCEPVSLERGDVNFTIGKNIFRTDNQAAYFFHCLESSCIVQKVDINNNIDNDDVDNDDIESRNSRYLTLTAQ